MAIRGSTPRSALHFSASRALSLLGSPALTDDISVAATQAVDAEARAAAADMQVSDSVIMCTRHTHTYTHMFRSLLSTTYHSEHFVQPGHTSRNGGLDL